MGSFGDKRMHYNAFKHFREEERYEVGLASGRLASLLASQAFLFTGWAIIHGQTGTNSPKLVLITVPAVAFVICLVAFFAILVAVIVIRRWQWHGYRLVSEDQNADPPELMNFHLNRKPGDWYHMAGVDLFSLVISIAFMILWAIIFVHSIKIPVPQLTSPAKTQQAVGMP